MILTKEIAMRIERGEQMKAVKVVISISEDVYRDIMDDYEKDRWKLTWYDEMIAKGTPLPKGHGDLKDADNLKNELQAFHDFLANAWGGFKNMPNEDKRVADTILQCIAQIVNDPTIIEADY